jgi:excinuclease ABC subunit C
VVASLVVFEDGLARKSEYRRFAVREGAQRGDVGSMAEVVRRRFANYLRETAEPASATADGTGRGVDGAALQAGRARKFAYPPNLLVVDGGQPQVEAAADVLAELGVQDVAVVGLAKRLEEVWLPADPDPVILGRTSEALYLLQRVRDEAHRFAISYHRAKRGKRMSASVLDEVPGLGETRKAALLKHFGSVRKLTAATIEEISGVPGVGRHTAQAVHATLAGGTPADAITEDRTTATGESDMPDREGR